MLLHFAKNISKSYQQLKKFTLTPVTERFIRAFKRLSEDGVFKTQGELIADIRWDQSSLSSVLNKKRNIPLEKAMTFCKKYGISQNWMIDGSGEMLAESKGKGASGSSNADDVNLPSNYKDLLIETLKEHIEQQKELINIQSETIKALKEQNQVRPNIVQQPSKKQT